MDLESVKQKYRAQKKADQKRKYYLSHPEQRAKWKIWFTKYRRENKAYNTKFRKGYIDKLNIRRLELIKFVLKSKFSGCSDCGVKHNPWVMHFDHRQGTSKIADISYMVNGNFPIDIVKSEMEKCDVVCSNCHAERGFRRSGRTTYRGIQLTEIEELRKAYG